MCVSDVAFVYLTIQAKEQVGKEARAKAVAKASSGLEKDLTLLGLLPSLSRAHLPPLCPVC